jgi:hypothetical protein
MVFSVSVVKRPGGGAGAGMMVGDGRPAELVAAVCALRRPARCFSAGREQQQQRHACGGDQSVCLFRVASGCRESAALPLRRGGAEESSSPQNSLLLRPPPLLFPNHSLFPKPTSRLATKDGSPAQEDGGLCPGLEARGRRQGVQPPALVGSGAEVLFSLLSCLLPPSLPLFARPSRAWSQGRGQDRAPSGVISGARVPERPEYRALEPRRASRG